MESFPRKTQLGHCEQPPLRKNGVAMPAEVDLATLTQEQQQALQQFTSVTDQELSTAIPLLERCQWNVQIAIARFFDGEPADPIADPATSGTPGQPSARREVLINGLSPSTVRGAPQRRFEPAPRIVPQPYNHGAQPPFPLSTLVPVFNVLYGFLSRSLRLLAYPFSFIPRLYWWILGRNNQQGDQRRSGGGRRPLNPRDTAARFRRELEEDYGSGELQSLPFVEDGYAQAYDRAKKELKYLLVVLLTPEHDDTGAFVRETLLSDQVKDFLNRSRNDILLWGGSVQDPEAYEVSSSLNCTKFPFAALIAHTPSVSSTAMSVIARITGPIAPSTFIARLQTAMSQNSESLNRARAARAEQQATRNIRNEQNSAYERSLAQDRERARQRREAEEARALAERQAREKAETEVRNVQNQEQWRRWRAQSLKSEPAPDIKDAVRISIRMPSGERVVRRFEPDAGLEELYAFVECYDLHKQGVSEEQYEKPRDYTHVYRFRLASPLPRQAYDLGDGGTIKKRIGKSGNLIVERVEAEDDSDVEP